MFVRSGGAFHVAARGALLLALAAPLPRLIAEGAPKLPVVTSAGELWNVSEATKLTPHPLRMEFIVSYYDPVWNVLWGEENGNGFYLPVRSRPLPIRTGQRIRLEGTVVPAQGLNGDWLTVTVLEENALPAPIPANRRLGDFAQLDIHWVEFEGYVSGQSEPDATHTLFLVMSGGHLVYLRLQSNGTDPVPQLTGARVRVRALYVATRDASGALQQIDCWTHRVSDIRPEGWLADDLRFKLPRTSLDQIDRVRGQPWVHVTGEVRAQDPGKSLTLRDDAGQIQMATPQPELLPEQTMIDVVGRPVLRDGVWTLDEILLRRTASSSVAGGHGTPAAPARLRLAAQVQELSAEEAAKRYPVSLRGVVTWADPAATYFYLQDGSGGVRISRKATPIAALTIGSTIAVMGVSVAESMGSAVELQEATVLGTGTLPSARNVTLEQALSGAEEGRRVEIRGFLRRVERNGDAMRLDLTTASGEFTAIAPPDEAFASMQGALVRVRGVCAIQNKLVRELATVQLWIPDRDSVVVDEPAAADPFSAPVRSISALRQSAVSEGINRRVRISGQVQLHVPGRYLYLQDETGGIFVLTRSTDALFPGQWIDVAGFPGRAGSRLAVREGVWRQASARDPIAPLQIDGTALVPAADAKLVRFSALLRQTVSDGVETRMTLQTGDLIADAVIHAPATWTPPEPGSRLELTGVYALEFDESRRPHAFRVELRQPADVRVLATPPWWTLQRVVIVAGVLLLFTAVTIGWIIALRRRVGAQTVQIRQQLEKETRLHAELERSTRLESLGVLAGGIAHDFNNLLTAILGNLGLAALDKRAMEAAGDCIVEAEKAARRARDITQQLLTFAKGGDPIRAAVALPDVITEAAGFARHGTNVRLEFDFPVGLPPGDVDAGQISRVVHNLVINAVQAMPEGGVIRIALAAVDLAAGEVESLIAGRYLRLTVSDAGTGIPPENLARIFDPYFSTKSKNHGLGLATVHSIVKKHQGHIAVESTVGHGTTFRIWLPAAQAATDRVSAPVRANGSSDATRILVMDDEDVIRRVVGKMLERSGHQVEFAPDGEAAVHAYLEARSSQRPFDLVIFDLTVPGGMGGKDALQRILQQDPRVRAVAASGYSNDPVMANPMRFGFRARLCKPYEITDLMRAIDEAMRN